MRMFDNDYTTTRTSRRYSTGPTDYSGNGNRREVMYTTATAQPEPFKRPTLPPEGKVLTGVVKWFGEKFNEKTGITKKTSFGFILDSDNNEYFTHYKAIKSVDNSFKNLAKGQHVKFIGKEGPKGLYAEQVEVING